MIHSEGKRDIQYDGLVTPSKACNVFAEKTIEEKVDQLFTAHVILTPEKTTRVQPVQKYRRSHYRNMMWTAGLQKISHRIEGFRIKLQKKIVSLLLTFLLLFVVVVAAPFANVDNNSELLVSISPAMVWTGDCLYVNVTVPSSANITSGTCDMGGIETINLSLVDTDSVNQLWQAVWIVHEVPVGEYIAAITVIDEDNTSYHTEVGWSVLPEEQLGEAQQNETQNGTVPPTNVTTENETANISIIPELSIWDDSDSQKRYVGEHITFYANYSVHESIDNVTCLISFNLGTWTEPERMNYSQGLYVYSRGFDAGGIVEFKVVCSALGQGNTTVVSECVISIDKPCVFEPVTQIEIGKPVEWKQSFDVENNFTVNISGSAYNISVDDVVSEDDVIVVENVSKSLQEYNLEKGKDALAKEIKGLLQSINGGSNEASSQQELYQLYGMLKGNIPFEEILKETYDDIEHYIDQFIFKDAEAQLILSNVSGEVEVKYFTEAPKILENIIDDSRKQILVYSDVHYENVFTYTSIVESPRDCVKLFWVVNGSYVPIKNAIYVDTNSNGFIDRIEWITPYLSNQTFEIVITKAEHLNENREFLSEVYDEVYRKDGIWSEPIYHHEYVRVTFEDNLTKFNDVTLYVRNTQGLDTIVEIYYKDSDEKITEFPIIGEEDFYKVYLTGMIGRHRTFDLRVKNLDNLSSAYLEFDYIVDPTGWVSPTGFSDPSNQWAAETKVYDDNTGTYSEHTGAAGWRGFLELTLSSAIYCDRVRVFSDFGYGVVDLVDIDIYNSTSWIDKYNGTINDAAWTELPFSAETNVTKARFRYHYLANGWNFWLYEFDFWQGQPLTLPNCTTLNATSIDETTAILKGNVSDDGGEPCEYRFQYGSDTSYGNDTTWGGSEAKDSEFHIMIHNLTLGNTYQFRVQVRNSVGTVNGSNKNFTTAIPSLGWVTPTSHYDPNSQWENENNSNDDDTDTYARSLHNANDPDGQWSFYIYVNHSVLLCDKVRFCAKGPTGDAFHIDQADLDVKKGGVWVDVFNGTFSDRQWVEKSFTQGSVTQARMRFHINANGGGLYYELYEFDFNNSRPVPTITNAGPTNGSWGVNLLPQMNITVNNPDGVNMTISWYSNSSGSWQLFGINSSVGNGTYHQQNNNFSVNNTRYWWKISVTDGMDTNTSWYYFSTPDTTKPSSNVVAITPYWKTTSPITITATASDTGWSGLKNVTLYYRFSSNNVSWGGWVSAGVDTASPWSWSLGFSNGSGFYQFYSIAKDNATNTEAAPGSSDAWCGYDTIASTSSVNMISPYWKNIAATITAFSSDATSGTKNVTLYYRFSSANASWGGWVSAGVDTALPWNWSFSFSNGSGYYQFYSIAKDNATNAESAPATNDTNCGYDNQAPSSSVDAITPYWKKAAATITATASDATNGVKNVTLYYRFGSNNASWGGWVSAGVDTVLPWNWSFSFSNGSGYYQFYSIAKDNATNTESTPGGADAQCGYDITAPSSSVDAITPYWKKSSPLTIAATASDSTSGVKNVTLCYRYSNDNISWEGYVSFGVDTASPWSWSFTFSNDTGYYEFYSIAKDNTTNIESAPGSADTICFYTNVTTPIVITNASTGVEETNATLWGYLQSDGGESCTVRFEYGTSTSYGTNTTNQTKTTGQTYSVDITSLTKGQLYYYRAFANNTLDSYTGDDLTFLTKPDSPNTLNAQANSSSMIYLTWNIGTGANSTYIERNASGQTIWTRGQGEFVYNGSAIKYEDSGRNPGTTYYYQAWSFTTWTYNLTLSQYSDDNDSTSAATGADISIGVTPSIWNQGAILIGSSNATTGFYFNITNQGVVPINIQIKATNATNVTTGANWNLTGSSGLDNFSLQYKKSGDEDWTTINLTYDTFMLNLPATGTDWQTFDLNLIMATTSSTGDPLSLTITFKSVAA
ncbi:MAG TPA: hypothetical protein VMY59_07095 [Candidatus Thermoplasmatota archaeon]|nr:hypothetical protein [Candidatus Thermoplasmatota archaeon]